MDIMNMSDITEKSDTNIGSARNDAPVSASQVLSTLAPTAIYAGAFFLCFLIVRRWFPRVYNPRSFLGSLRPQERSPVLPNGWFNWVRTFFQVSDTAVLRHNSLDGFLFLRSLKIYVVCCIVGCIITWPILFPVYATGPGGARQLSILTMANSVDTSNTQSYFRYYAPVFCAYVYFIFLMYMITRETIYYINLRQAYLVSPLYANRISSKTVLFTSVPDHYLDEGVLKEIFGKKDIVRIWIPRQTKELEEAVEKRDKLVVQLENAETKLIRKADGNRRKDIKEKEKAQKKGQRPAAADDEIQLRDLKSTTDPAEKWLKEEERPMHRLHYLGKKVDTIDWCREELSKVIPEIESLRNDHRGGKGKCMNSVFIQFQGLKEAQAAYQSLTHHSPLHMAPRYTGMTPNELNWTTFRIRWWERVIRNLGVVGIITAMIIFWSFPVAFVGALSSLDSLLKILPFLGFLRNLPLSLQGVVTGLLPSVLLALLFWLLPIVLRFLAVQSGVPTKSGVEQHVQKSYFAFQVIQVFLVTTLSSGIFQSLDDLKGLTNPTNIVTILAQNLPKASNFYLSYFIIQGLGVVSNVLLGLVGLILFVVLGKFLDNSPRKRFTRWTVLSPMQLGTLYPIYSNLFVIAVSYAIIAPLVGIFAVIGLTLFYLAYRYNFLFVYGLENDTKGLMYATCLQQMFVGIYLAEFCLIGLFAIGTGASGGALGPLILGIILAVITVLYHWSFQQAVSPLLSYLPKTLETEERRLLAMEETGTSANIEDDKERFSGDGDYPDVHASNLKLWDVKARARAALERKPTSLFKKFIRPDIYSDYYSMRKLVPREFAKIEYAEHEEADAYLHPSVKSEASLIWIPRDVSGVSKREIAETSKVLPITDEGAWLDEKTGEICWDRDEAWRAPIWEKQVFY